MRRRQTIAFVTMLAALLAGCNRGGETPQVDRLRPRVGRAPRIDFGKGDLPTEIACRRFASRLEHAAANADWAEVNRCVDWEGLAVQIGDALDGGEELADPLDVDVRTAITANGGLLRKILSQVDGGAYRLVRFRRGPEGVRALFRLAGTSQLDYHEFLLKKQGAEVVASDLRIYSKGELISETLLQTLQPLLHQHDQYAGASPWQRDYFFQDLETLAAIQHAIKAGNPAAALQLFDTLPTAMKEMKPVQLLRYHSAVVSNDADLVEAATADYDRLFPDDPAIDLIAIGAFRVQQRYREALSALDRLDRRLGGDSYLDIIRARLYLRAGELEPAARLARIAIANYPSSEFAHDVFLAVLIIERDHEALYNAMHAYEQRLSPAWGDLRERPEFAHFVESPYGRRWLEEHHSRHSSGVSLASAESPVDGFLIWTGPTGVSIEAKLVARTPTELQLGTRDGQVLYVPLENLNAASRAQAELFLR